ncbi:hypothetical protein LPTSP4_05900 [Leptospira ryugenii]|uniref:Type II secretion system protein N n=1 Tax=Leptospira ryugenii TaxID=1917863 RepID=A0A2P2DWR1_9LEPT|nr:type II secretion system protein GspN [Leptospira ryugenii]GBF49081.1 hypothetical protein LPTSP4_05900 [Leptospira ryugenii]
MERESELKDEEDEFLDAETLQESLLDEDESLAEDEEIEEAKKLTTQKIISLVGFGIASFFIFVLFTFPLDEMVRSLLGRLSKETGMTIEAKEIHFPLLGRKSFDAFSLQFNNGNLLKAEELSVSVSLLGLLGQRWEGDTEIGFFRYEGSELVLQIRSLKFPLRLAMLDEKISKWAGEGEIELAGGKILESMEIPLLGSLKDTELKRGSLQFKIRAGKMSIEKGNFETNMARFQIQGVIRLSDAFGLSQLDLKVCGILNEKFSQERPDIAGLATLLPQENGRICVPVRGSINAPKVDLPNLNQFGNPNIQTTEEKPAQ